MAKVTLDELRTLTDGVTKLYEKTVDELLINIAKHFKSDKAMANSKWRQKKLAELEKVREESIKIIARNMKTAPEDIQDSFKSVYDLATRDITQELDDAVDQGFINRSSGRSRKQKLINDYYKQVRVKCNSANYTMLDSTLETYRQTVNDTSRIEQSLDDIKEYIESEAFRARDYSKMKSAYRRVVQKVADDGFVLTRKNLNEQLKTMSLEEALAKMSERGLYAFVDRAGRLWSPEAYIGMVMRTTAHNLAIDSIRSEMADHGTDIFRVSAHTGARPLCYPYQGLYFSWGTRRGYWSTGDGQRLYYGSYELDTTCHEPAGLFQINCGHYPIPCIMGKTIPEEMVIQPKEENDEEYANKQKQRRLERNIREAKRDVQMCKSAGLGKADIKKNESKVRTEQRKLREFIKETGLERKAEREQIANVKIGDGKFYGLPPSMQKYPKIQENIGIGDLVKRVNPYRGQIGGNENCVSCSTALSLSLLGIDAEALPFANWMNRYIDHPEMAWKLLEQPIVERYDRLRDSIEQEMLIWGDGSICIITISMGHKGHAFVGFQFGNKTYYFDGQTGSLNCEDYFSKADRTTVDQFGNIKDAGYRFFRVDNAVLTGIGRNLVRFRR